MIIKLRCRCGNEMDYDTKVDPSLPMNVASILSDKCLECDDGDFGSETWFDAQGKEICQNLTDYRT